MKLFSVLCAAAAAWSLNAAQPDQDLIQTTLSHVDTNGTYLYYHNTQGILKFVNKIPGFVDDVLIAAKEKDTPNGQMVKEGTEIFLRLLNFSALKSYAESEVRGPNGEYLFRMYAHFGQDGMKQSSLLHLCNSGKNHPLDLETLPENTILAYRFSCQLDKLYEAVMNELENSKYLRDIAIQINQEAEKEQVDPREFLKSISDDAVFVISGSSMENIVITLIISDQQEKLTAELKKFYPVKEGKDYAVLSPKNGSYEPVLRYAKGKLIFCSTPAVPKYKPIAIMKGVTGLGYFYVNVNEDLIRSFGKKIKDPQTKTLYAKYITPFHVLAVQQLMPEGYLTSVQTNFSIADLMCSHFPVASSVLLPVMTGVLLPVFSDANAANGQPVRTE